MRIVIAWLSLLAPVTFAAAGPPAADLLIRHARVWTGNSAQPEASAVAVLDGRIVAVGSEADVGRWRGPATRVVDAGGRRLMPGFNDSHVHFADGGAGLAAVQLNDAASNAEFVRRIGAYAAHSAPGEWLIAGEWDETKWQPATLPTRQQVDAVTPDNPVALDRYDGHAILANSRALALAGVTKATVDPPGGVIVRDDHGELTGVLKDAAMDLVTRVIPKLTPAQRRRAVERALREAAADGVTSVQDMAVDPETIATYAELLEEDRLTVRVYAAPGIGHVEDLARVGLRRAFGGPSLRVGALKAFADGSLGSRTAYFFDGFTDAPGEHGLLSEEMQPLDKMARRMQLADASSLQLCTHAIGDAGISAILDLYAGIEQASGKRDRRWRIEHAQHMAEKDFDRFAALGVIASVQPYHAIDDGRWAEARIGHDRASRTYAFRTFLNHGVRLAFGTDWPVAPLNPFLGLYAATTRATLDGRHPQGWFPEQKLTLAEAVAAYTQGSAYAEFQDREKGSIQPGRLADMILVDRDPFAIPPQELRGVRVLTTWVGGRVVYQADPAVP